jgi:GWxTD domain-containing protein
MVQGTSRSLLLAIVLLSAFLADQASAQSPLNDLFQTGKRQFKMAAYEASLTTFQRLDETSRAPAFEAERVKLEPLIAFYRGANLAALGRVEIAQKEFQKYLESFPTAHLDPAAFPKSVIQVFERVKQATSAAGSSNHPITAASPIVQEYARFHPAPDRPSQQADERWADSAVRFLMTKAEREEWPRISTSQARAEFVTKFWQKRDPNLLTPENEYRDEIERRIAFGDTRFGEGEKKGSQTDRGMVFVLLGPPSYIGQRPLTSEDDSIQIARDAPTQEISYDSRGRRIVQTVPRDPITAQTLQGTREIWYYRRDRLPKTVRFTEVDFEFLTKKGVGTAVLQRDHQVLTALEEAARVNLSSAN